MFAVFRSSLYNASRIELEGPLIPFAEAIMKGVSNVSFHKLCLYLYMWFAYVGYLVMQKYYQRISIIHLWQYIQKQTLRLKYISFVMSGSAFDFF